MAVEPELVCVYECQGIDLAQIYKSKLEAEGIPVLLKYDAGGIIFGLTIDGFGLVRLMVPAEFAADAEALLSEEVEWEEGGEEPAPEEPAESS